MTVAMVLTITRLTANGGCHFVFDLVLFRLRNGGYGCGSGAYCCNGGGSCSRFRYLEGDDAGLVRWIAAEMVVRCCIYGYSVQMRCWLRCINGVAVVENDGVEDAGAMEARSSGGYGNVAERCCGGEQWRLSVRSMADGGGM
ncbi:hypothetical protein DEO72_LG1g2676 [Vigna unguiculata]|uniref:Uncharacterized protein n=1 Tax=Vigna unguiculata TaxID=3917 RepID=A0A4D6KUU1_VIGUN|nr:hypothetical protein DEO72_LG1g2676 [Vigna unguiculata]